MTRRQPTRTTTSTVTSGEPRPPRWLVTTVVLLLVVLVAFIVIRLLSDLPYLVDDRVPEEGDFARRYVQHPRTAYLHIATGVLFLAGALLQVSYRRRRRAYAAHRLRGRVLVALGWVACGSALAFGLPHAFGGRGEAAATALFGAWMAACLALGLAAARRHDIPAHRRWMVRAFAVALAVGTIRIWLGLLVAAGSLTLRDSFAPAFWLAFSMHVVVAEVWLRRFPPPPDAARPAACRPDHDEGDLMQTTTMGPGRLAARALVLVLAVGLVPAGNAATGRQRDGAVAGSSGVGDAYFPLDGNGGYQVRHYTLDLRYTPSTGRLRGTGELTARARSDLTRFDLDFLPAAVLGHRRRSTRGLPQGREARGS